MKWNKINHFKCGQFTVYNFYFCLSRCLKEKLKKNKKKKRKDIWMILLLRNRIVVTWSTWITSGQYNENNREIFFFSFFLDLQFPYSISRYVRRFYPSSLFKCYKLITRSKANECKLSRKFLFCLQTIRATNRSFFLSFPKIK